jgi:hypothetical protein
MAIDRVRRLGAILIVAVSAAMTAFSIASLFLPGSDQLPDRPDLFSGIVFSLIFLAFPSVGLVVTWKRPLHPVGWLLLLVGALLTLSVFTTEYVGRAVYLGAPLPGAVLVAWAGGWTWYVAAGLALPLAIALFPTGTLPGPRWRAAFAVTVPAVVALVVLYLVLPGDIEGFGGLVQNPFGVTGLVGELATASAPAGTPAIVVMVGLALGTVVSRFRTGSPEVRQQLKWLLAPVVILLVGVVAAAVIVDPLNSLAWSVALVGLALFPVSIGIAILRYRLYDIDLVVRRTLVYGAVVAILGAVYVGLVLALQSVLSAWTGNQTVPVAISTLAIAALFGPLRRRVREGVDRRFYRSRYDAQRTLEAFAGSLRDEVELEAVAGRLAEVASLTVRPASASVWLRLRAHR